jgi:hypothetical protein
VGEEPRLFQTVHAFSNFNEYPAVDGSCVEVVLLDNLLGKAGQQHLHVFKPWQRVAEIIVFDVHHHHGDVLSGEGAVD